MMMNIPTSGAPFLGIRGWQPRGPELSLPLLPFTCGRLLSFIYPIWPLLVNPCFLPTPMLLVFPRARESFHFHIPPSGHGRGGSPFNRARAHLADTQLTRNHLLSKAKSKIKPDGLEMECSLPNLTVEEDRLSKLVSK
jgi:hypothetical protein